jgi:hypothetical protein
MTDAPEVSKMARKVLFMIHGIAQRAPDDAADKPRAAADGWHVDLIKNFVALAGQHAPGVNIGLDPGADGVKIVPLSYCDLLIEQLQLWDSVGDKKVADAVAGKFPGLPAASVNLLRDISTSDAPYFWQGGVDLLLYRMLNDVAIRSHVRSQVTKALADNAENGVLPACGFVTHSMGTAVMHDVLAEIFANPQTFGGFVNMDIDIYVSLANCSKIMENLSNPQTSTVRPFGATGVGRARCRSFINAHHAADPIPYLGLFTPDWSTATTPYRDVRIDRIKEPNTHSYQRYLENPRVWVPIFRTLLETSISKQQANDLITEYDATPAAACPQALDDLAQAVKAIADAWKNRAGAVNAWHFVVAATKARRALDEARKQCFGAGGGLGAII